MISLLGVILMGGAVSSVLMRLRNLRLQAQAKLFKVVAEPPAPKSSPELIARFHAGELFKTRAHQ